MRFIIITGTSGAGKTTAFHHFEDAGYFAVDNVLPRLLPALAESCSEEGRERVVAVVDSRAGDALAELPGVMETLKAGGILAELLFLDASDEILIRRFKETRRPHPTFESDGQTILEAIRAERHMLEEILDHADKRLDTSNMNPHELRDELADVTSEKLGSGTLVTVESFGFKHGLPTDADLVFDVRFLANPHYVPELKALTGSVPKVARYIHADPLTAPFLERVYGLLDFSLPEYVREGKAYLTVAIGCTGGRHRSVCIAEDVAAHLRGKCYRVAVHHRDTEREPPAGERRK